MKATSLLLCVSALPFVLAGGSNATATSMGVAASETLHPSVIIDQMRLAADYLIATRGGIVAADCDWQAGAFLQGVMAVYNATGDMKYKEYALNWSNGHKFEACHYPDTLKLIDAANDESCGQTYTELYLLDKNETYLTNIETVLAEQVNRSKVDDWWWVDAFFMAMGTFSRVGTSASDWLERSHTVHSVVALAHARSGCTHQRCQRQRTCAHACMRVLPFFQDTPRETTAFMRRTSRYSTTLH